MSRIALPLLPSCRRSEGLQLLQAPSAPRPASDSTAAIQSILLSDMRGTSCADRTALIVDRIKHSPEATKVTVLSRLIGEARAVDWDECENVIAQLLDSHLNSSLSFKTLLGSVVGIQSLGTVAGRDYIRDGIATLDLIATRSPGLARRFCAVLPEVWKKAGPLGFNSLLTMATAKFAFSLPASEAAQFFVNCLTAAFNSPFVNTPLRNELISTLAVSFVEVSLAYGGYRRALRALDSFEKLAGKFDVSIAHKTKVMRAMLDKKAGTWEAYRVVEWDRPVDPPNMIDSRAFREVREVLGLSVSDTRRLLHPGARVMEVGIGKGVALREIAMEYPVAEIHGTEVNCQLIRNGRAMSRALPNFQSQNRPEIHGTDGEIPDFPAGYFNFTYSAFAFPYYCGSASELEETISGLARITARGGTIRLGPFGITKNRFPDRATGFPSSTTLDPSSEAVCSLLDRFGTSWRYIATTTRSQGGAGNRVDHDLALDITV